MSENTESMLFTVIREKEQKTVAVKFKHKGQIYGTYVHVDDLSEETLRDALAVLLGSAFDMMEALDEQAHEGAVDSAGG